MKRSQLLILIFAALAVAGVALVSAVGGDGGDDDAGDGAGPAAPEGAVAVSFAYSPEKEKLLAPLIKRFNSERMEATHRASALQCQKNSPWPVYARDRHLHNQRRLA